MIVYELKSHDLKYYESELEYKAELHYNRTDIYKRGYFSEFHGEGLSDTIEVAFLGGVLLC